MKTHWTQAALAALILVVGCSSHRKGTGNSLKAGANLGGPKLRVGVAGFENKTKYGSLVGSAQVELYKSGKGMGWNLQLRPPEKDWNKATAIVDRVAEAAAGATIEPQEDSGGIQEPIHRPDAGTGA